MRNIELKARCADTELMRERLERLGARPLGAIAQRDTFFAAPRGRLKLRLQDDGRGELIAYRRPDQAAPRASDYLIYPTLEPAVLRAVLADALGETGVVEKRRRVWLHGHTRIHLDEVAGLGAFVELETVLEGQSEDEARAELARIAKALDLDATDLVAGAYVDLRP